MKRFVHGAFGYVCRSCGERRLLWLEKGLEEACNNKLIEPSGLPHKPTPFCIVCPRCRKLEMMHTGGAMYLPTFEPAKKGDDLFINSKKHDCGKPVFDWKGE